MALDLTDGQVGGSHLALTQNGTLVTDIHNLTQLVGDEDHSQAFRSQLAQQLEELLGFLRGQHSGRLVQDQQLGITEQCLQNFQTLLFTDGQVLHLLPGRDGHIEFFSQFGKMLGRLIQVQTNLAELLIAQHNVLNDTQGGNQHKMLVDHADTGSNGLLGVADVQLLAVQPDLTGGGAVQAVQNVHQGGLACTVFAQQGMNVALFHRKAHIFIGNNRAKPLGYML